MSVHFYAIRIYVVKIILRTISPDIDECATGVHNCKSNEQCINRHGNFICKCADGYKLVNGTCEGMYGSFIVLVIQ